MTHAHHPPKPRLARSVGVVAHRPNRLPQTARAKVAADVGELLLRNSTSAGGGWGLKQRVFQRRAAGIVTYPRNCRRRRSDRGNRGP